MENNERMEMIRLNDTPEFQGFSGTQHHYALFPGTVITDGVKHLGDRYGCYWFLNEVAFRQRQLRQHTFQVWTLVRNHSSSWAFRVTVTDGNKNRLLAFDVPFSDFRAGQVELWYTGGVILLPSEY